MWLGTFSATELGSRTWLERLEVILGSMLTELDILDLGIRGRPQELGYDSLSLASELSILDLDHGALYFGAWLGQLFVHSDVNDLELSIRARP